MDLRFKSHNIQLMGDQRIFFALVRIEELRELANELETSREDNRLANADEINSIFSKYVNKLPIFGQITLSKDSEDYRYQKSSIVL